MDEEFVCCSRICDERQSTDGWPFRLFVVNRMLGRSRASVAREKQVECCMTWVGCRFTCMGFASVANVCAGSVVGHRFAEDVGALLEVVDRGRRSAGQEGMRFLFLHQDREGRV